jgi:hypothetical protein
LVFLLQWEMHTTFLHTTFFQSTGVKTEHFLPKLNFALQLANKKVSYQSFIRTIKMKYTFYWPINILLFVNWPVLVIMGTHNVRVNLICLVVCDVSSFCFVKFSGIARYDIFFSSVFHFYASISFKNPLQPPNYLRLSTLGTYSR